MFTQSNLVLIIVGLAGLFVGLLVSSLFFSRDAKSRRSNRPTPEMEKEGFLEVARLWYSPTSKRIMPELNGEFIPDHASLTPEQQKKIFRISDLLGEWVRKIPTVVVPPVATSQEPAAPSPFTSSVSPMDQSDQPSPFIETPQLENITPVTTSLPPKKKTPEQEEILNRFAAEDNEEKKSDTKPRKIAGQISLILEEMIKDSPLKEKGIRLIEREDHGVDVWIGEEKYDSVDAIPYPEARQMIKAAAARWEKEASLSAKLGED